MSFGLDILNPKASVTIGLQGLAACSYNATFNSNQGRWEVAIPRFGDHILRFQIDGIRNLIVDPTVRIIEIKDRVGVPAIPQHEVGANFDRKTRTDENKNDFRWITDYDNNDEIPQGAVSIKENPVSVTMMYIYDATFYSKQIVPTGTGFLLRADLNSTGPIGDNRLPTLPEDVGNLLDDLDADGKFGFSAATVGIDIQSPRGGAVDILFDKKNIATISQGDTPQEILIVNREPPTASTAGRTVATDNFIYGRGDFFRYYELFDVDGQKFHLWERHEKNEIPLPGSTGDCNPIRTKTAGFAGLLSPVAPLFQ